MTHRSTLLKEIGQQHNPGRMCLRLQNGLGLTLLSRLSLTFYAATLRKCGDCSPFPTGTEGAALLLLRCSVAATLAVDGTSHLALLTSGWLVTGLAVSVTLLVLGLFIPYCATLCCLYQVSLLLFTGGRNEFHLSVSLLNSGILALLGPGAHSLDAHIFGRRLLTVPFRQ